MKRNRPEGPQAPRGPGPWRQQALGALLGTFLCLAPVPGGASPAAHHHDEHAGPNEPQRLAFLQAARTALARGDSQFALDRLDEAAAMAHAPDAELLMVLAQLQRGDFRHALTFASHAAGAHKDEPQALALYAWLLGLSEQRAYAARIVDDGLTRLPGDEHLLAVKQQLARLEPGAPTETTPPHDDDLPGPLASGAEPPATAQAVASGLLLGDGRQALVPLNAVQGAQALWVRNGLGTARAARVTQRLEAAGLALLSLDTPMPLPAGALLARAPRDAFAGSPVSALTQLADSSPRPAWPAMRTGFLGRAGMAGPQALGAELPKGPPGGPVFDQAGRLVGIVVAGDQPQMPPRMAPLSALLAALPQVMDALPVATDAARRAPDQLYEQALPVTLQVLSSPQ